MTAVLDRPVVHHTYEPRGAAKQLFECRANEVLLSGPAGTGKSRACLEKGNLIALLNPGSRGLVVRKTRESLTSTGLVTFREKVAKEGIQHAVLRFYGGSKEEPAQYRYSNGSTITLGGMDKQTKIMSSEYDWIYAQEATELTKADWEACTTRLRNGVLSFQQLMADCNPDAPTHWLKRRCDDGATQMLYSRHEDNPVLFNADGTLTDAGRVYIGRLDALTGVRLQRLRYGRWAAAEGLVYEQWDPAVHLIDRFDIPADWPRYWVVDFGYTNPFVCQWWAIDPDGRAIRYREIYQTRTLVEDHARQMLSTVRRARRNLGRKADPARAGDWEWAEPRPRAIICDHDAEDRATLERHLGLSTTKARKSVHDGIQGVESRLTVQPDGKPRLQFMRDSLVKRDSSLVDAGKPACTEEEFPGYVWPSGIAGGKDRNAAENPVKENDHGMDTTRYLAAELDFGGRPNIRWLG